MDLGEGARHHHVVGGRGELDAALVVVPPHVFGIGRVEDEDDVGREPGMKPPHLVERDVGAGRVVGVGDEDDARLLRHPRQDGVDVGGEILFRRDDRCASGGPDGDGINGEAMLGVDALLAMADEAVGHEEEDVVRAGAADDAVRIEAIGVAIAARSSRTEPSG